MSAITIIDSRDIEQLSQQLEEMVKEGPVQVKLLGKKARSLSQNRMMWLKLNELERTKRWHGMKLAASNWKNLISAGLEERVTVPNIAGSGFVVLGRSTSQMSVKQMIDVIDIADCLLQTLD